MPTIRLDDPDPTVLDGRHIRASAFEHAQQELLIQLPPATTGDRPARALTIGAGYARLPHLIADAGYQVTALDPSLQATAAARQQPSHGPAVAHRVRERPELDEQTDSFDLVWCIDTLETEPDPRHTLTEIARVVRPGGTIVLDTITDTVVSRVIYLWLFQSFGPTRVMPAGRYRRDRMLTPAALTTACHDAGITVDRIVGYEPGSAAALLTALLARRRRAITDEQLPGRARFRLAAADHSPLVTYFAVAKPAASNL